VSQEESGGWGTTREPRLSHQSYLFLSLSRALLPFCFTPMSLALSLPVFQCQKIHRMKERREGREDVKEKGRRGGGERGKIETKNLYLYPKPRRRERRRRGEAFFSCVSVTFTLTPTPHLRSLLRSTRRTNDSARRQETEERAETTRVGKRISQKKKQQKTKQKKRTDKRKEPYDGGDYGTPERTKAERTGVFVVFRCLCSFFFSRSCGSERGEMEMF